MKTATKIGENIYRDAEHNWIYIRLDSGKLTAFQKEELLFAPDMTWMIQVVVQYPDFECGVWTGQWRTA